MIMIIIIIIIIIRFMAVQESSGFMVEDRGLRFLKASMHAELRNSWEFVCKVTLRVPKRFRGLGV